MAKRARADAVTAITFLTAVSTVLLVLSTFSMPFNKSIYLFRLGAVANGIWRYVDFGVFGYCPLPIGLEKKSKNWLAKYPGCTKPTLGWIIGKDVTDVLQVQSALQDGLPKPMSSLLVSGPVASALAFIAFLVSLVICGTRNTSRSAANGAPISPINSSQLKAISSTVQIALSCATLAFIVDIIVLLRMNGLHISSLASQNPNLKYSSGNAIWFNGVAWFFLLLSILLANRLRRAAIQSQATAESNAQMAIDVAEMSNTPQPYHYVRPMDNSLPPPPPLPPPRSPDLREHHTDDAPPPYTTMPGNTTAIPVTPEPLITEGGRQFNFFRFGNNVSHV